MIYHILNKMIFQLSCMQYKHTSCPIGGVYETICGLQCKGKENGWKQDHVPSLTPTMCFESISLVYDYDFSFKLPTFFPTGICIIDIGHNKYNTYLSLGRSSRSSLNCNPP